MSGSSSVATQKAGTAAITRTSGAVLQRQCACGQHTIGGGECEECAEQRMSLQRRAAGPGAIPAVPPSVYDVLQTPGEPLDADTRAFMERRLSHDLSRVRVHNDAPAAESARSVNAMAYTVGRDVVFGLGQYAPRTTEGRRLLAHELTHVIQQRQTHWAALPATLEVAPADHPLEKESQRSTEAVDAGAANPAASAVARPVIQRATDTEGAAQEGVGTPPAAPAPARAALIVDDDAEPAPGQMRKTEFLDGLRAHVCEAADRALVSAGRTAQGCPLIQHWIERMRSKRANEIEQSIRRYAPESSAATTAREYYATVGERVRQGVERWARTGELIGVPPELLAEMGAGISGLLATVGGFFSSVGRLFAKARDGGVRPADPAAVQAQLRPGAPLEGGVRAKMEQVFGRGFGSVRVHTDSSSASAASALNARAFTVGDDLAFAPGEYQPGTLAGDALLAHELAHVAQQTDVESGTGGPATASLEEDADQSAFEAVASLWPGRRQKRTRNAMPQLRSPLSLRRCNSGPEWRNPQDVENEFQSARNEVMSGLANAETQREVGLTFDNLHGVYENALEDAGTDRGKQAQAQDDLIQNVRRLRASYQLQLTLTRRYHVAFTTGATEVERRAQPPRVRYAMHTWSTEELQKVDAILRRIPPGSLANVQKIDRQPGSDSDTIASWEDATHTMKLFDTFFSNGRSDDQRAQDLIHEIGHSTEVHRTVGTFLHLPSQDWMDLSDWQTATASSFGASVGVSGGEATEGQSRVDSAGRAYRGFPRPVRVGNRMVVVDRYMRETMIGSQYLHYDAAKDRQFVTDYARSHPHDDLAESYAQSVLNPQETRRKLDVPPNAPNKWNYLVRRLAQNAAAAQAAQAAQEAAGQGATGQPAGQAPTGAGQTVQPKLRSGGSNDIFEQEADRAAEHVLRAEHGGSSARPTPPVFAEAPVMVQRQAVEGEANSPAAAPRPVPGELQGGRQSRDLIVEDDAARLEPGQMRKGVFLEGLQQQACAAAEPQLSATGRSARGCPIIEQWINRLRSRSSAEVEGKIRRYAPEAAAATSAREYFAVVAQRVRQGVARWAATGDTSAVPPELASDLAGGGMAGMFAAAGAAISGAISSVGRLFGKAKDGGLRDADPAAIAGRLDSGASLDTGVRGKMESALGHSFGGVRVHTDSKAAGMAAEINARAFTIGSDIVFGAGEYRPGTEVGDALMAHELAHVVQQRNASPMLPAAVQDGDSQVLEADANLAAIGALGGPRSVPRRRASLRLQSCHPSNPVALPTLSALSAMSPYQLSQIPDETFAQAPTGDPAVARQYADYARGARVVRTIFARYQVTFDIERENRVLGRPPDGNELRVFNGLLGSVLAVPNVRGSLTASGGRGIPTEQGSSQPSLAGHVRVLRNRTEFLIKYYQLQWLVAEQLGPRNTELDRWLADEWRKEGINPGEHPTITPQERRAMALEAGVGMMSANPGFFFPPDDMFYLAPHVTDLRRPEVQAIARHEIVHLLGGRDRTRQAFVRRFGQTNYKKYWEPFEEGMAELINMEANPSQADIGAPDIPETSSGYGHFVHMMNDLMSEPGMTRATLFQAYFTGNIPDQVYQFLTGRIH